MITIFANWTGNALVSGATLDDARARLTFADCQPDTIFGTAADQMTALETGAQCVNDDTLPPLYQARKKYPAFAANGLCRP